MAGPRVLLRCKIELRKTNVIGNHHFLLCALKDKEKYYPYNHEEKEWDTNRENGLGLLCHLIY